MAQSIIIKGTDMDNQYVVFELADEFYGVNIAGVESIIKMQPVTRMPQAPEFIQGIINLRGKILPVMDLRMRFGLPMEDASKDSRIVVAALGRLQVGMIVDGVSEVLTLPESIIEPPPPMVTTIDSGFIVGIAKLEERLIILLDLGKVLNQEEQSSLGGF